MYLSSVFYVYLVEMFSVADSSQVFWLIIILFLKYNSFRKIKNNMEEINGKFIKKRNCICVYS